MRLLSFLLVFLFSLNVDAAGLSAPFNGSRFTGFTQPSTIVEYDHTVDYSANLVDLSGSNYATYSEDFNSWTKTNLTVSMNTARSPLYNTTTVDTLVEANDVAQQHSVYQSISLTSGVKYTFSVYFKAINRTWISLYVSTDAFQTYCDTATGATGTTVGSVIAKNQSIGSGWYRCSMQFTATETAARDLYIYIADQDNNTLFNGTGQDSVYLWGAQVALLDEWRLGPGAYHFTGAVNKPAFDAIINGASLLVQVKSQFQDASNRVIPTVNMWGYGGSPAFDCPFHPAFDIFDGDFTVTAVVRVDPPDPPDPIFSRSGGAKEAGVTLEVVSGSGLEFLFTMFNASGSIAVYSKAATYGGMIGYETSYVVQVVRSSDIGVVYVDGNPGFPVNVAGYGIDGILDFNYGHDNYTSFYPSDLVYFRIDATALSQEELARQRAAFRGAFVANGTAGIATRTVRYSSSGDRVFSQIDTGLISVNTDVPRAEEGLLVAGSATQLATYTQLFETDWHTENATVPADTDVSPIAGYSPSPSSYLVETSDESPPDMHGLYYDQVAAPGDMYTFSVYVLSMGGGRDWVWLANYYNSSPPAKGAFFNIREKYIGGADIGVIPRMEVLAGGIHTFWRSWVGEGDWLRISITTTSVGADFWTLASADDVPSISYVGDGRYAFYVWGAQLEAGPYATSYVENTSSTPIVSPADDVTVAPWRLTKNVSQGNPMFTMLFDNDVCVTSAPCNLYASEIGNYTFTVNRGDAAVDPDYPYETTHLANHSQGDYFQFDGHDDYISLAHADAGNFYPVGDFSIVAIVTPDVVTGTRTIFSTFAAGGTGGYRLYASNSDVNFYTETGLGNTTCTKVSALAANKTSLITLSFTRGVGVADSTCNIYVDGLSVGTSAVMRYPSARNAGIGIAATAVGGDPFSGKIHYISFYNAALTQTQHNANYAGVKQADVLPLLLGNGYEHKKLYLDFDSKCEWSSLSDIATSRELVNIGGNTGTADSDTNRIRVYGDTDGKLYAAIYPKDENTGRAMSTAVHADWNKWHAHKIMWDLADLTRSRFTTEGVYATLDATMTGAKNIEFTDTLIRLGQDYAGTVSGNCKIRNLRIRTAP